MTYYIVYKVTNDINGKFYIGTHKTSNINDGYMGSGKYLKYSQEKHGIENFTKAVLFVYDNSIEMFDKEAEIVNDDFIAEENTYNLKRGGCGGFDYINENGQNNINKSSDILAKGGKTVWENRRRDPLVYDSYIADLSVRLRKEHATGMRPTPPPHKVGEYHHSEETKKIMSEKAKERLKDPTANSQYGTCWIHSLTERANKKIRKSDPMPDGWMSGMIVDFDAHDAKILQHEKNQQIKLEQHHAKLDKLRELMYYYRDNVITLRGLSDKFNISRNIYKSFKKYFSDEYDQIIKNKNA